MTKEQLENRIGNLWSAWMDLNDGPETLEFDGPESKFDASNYWSFLMDFIRVHAKTTD